MKIEELVNDVKFVRHVIDMCLPFHQVYEMLDMQWSYDYNIYCAFHDNTDTPSARLYKNEDGSTTLWCFSEQRRYKPSDAIVKGLLNYRLESIFYRIWKQLSDNKKESLLNSYNQDFDFISDKWKEALPYLEKFKTGDITLSELRIAILKATV